MRFPAFISAFSSVAISAVSAIPAIAAITAITLIGCTADQIKERAKAAAESYRQSPPTNEQMIEGLKTALTDGSGAAANSLSAAGAFSKSEIYKIFLPPEADTIVKNIKLVPFGAKLVDDTIARINLSAEKAAVNAAPIFAKAIADMTIADAAGILRGGGTSATDYLKSKTTASLKSAFATHINKALSEPILAGISAQKSWDTLKNGYNGVANSLVGKAAKLTPVETALNDYVVDRALFAVFSEVGKAETAVHADPLGSSKEIVRKVFNYAKQAAN